MKPKHHFVFSAALYTAVALTAAAFSVTVTGCRLVLPFGQERPETVPYVQQAATTDEILQALVHSMARNENTCELFISDEALIDADSWLNALSGIEKIHCEYRAAGSGFNTVIQLEYWDNYAIVYAYRNRDTSYLTAKQQALYDRYLEILSDCTAPDRSDCANELAIHDYLVTHIEYDASRDSAYNAYDALIEGRAICGGYAECFKTFMDLLGIENTTITGTAGGEQHIWNAVCLDDSWYQVDVTWDDPVNASSITLDHTYFNVTDADMALDHTWDQKLYAPFPASDHRYSYPVFANLPHISSQEDLDVLIAGCIDSRAGRLEFTTQIEPDLKSSMALTETTLTYAYRTADRTNYRLYTIVFSYAN